MIFFKAVNRKLRLSALPHIFLVFCCMGLVGLSGCSLMVSSATSDYMKHLSATILNNDDLVLVETGAPAYLLMVDSLISKDPENQTLLTTAGLLYTAYSDIFVHDRERSRKMAAKALGYAGQAVCLAKPNACGFRSAPFETFHTFVSSMEKKHLPVLFALGNAWAGWIMANTDDFNAIADLSRIEIIMQQVIELDPTYRDGAAFLYLGTLASFLPPALGGKPEQGKLYFEKALSLSQGKNLMVKVIYAKLYARMVFNRPLHDRLLQEVIAADPRVEGYTLVNTWAQKQARELIAGGDDYF